MKCDYCNEKAEIVLKRFRDHSKVPYCRLHWKMLCMQETAKFLKVNNVTMEDFIKFVENELTIEDFFSHMTKH